jgi:hypothetical protein
MASKDRRDARDEAAYLKEAARQQERLELEEIGGSNIVSAEMEKEVQERQAKRNIYQQAIESGLTEDQARQKITDSGIGSVTPNLDRWAASSKSSTAQSRDLGTFKTYGDKSAFEAKNAVRKLQGLDPIAEPLPADKEFLVNLEKSASFGADSALVGDKATKGQARAFEAGIRAGYTPEETRKLIADTAARITGVVDQQAQDEQQPTAPTPQPTPKSPAQPPFFEQVYNQFKTPDTPTPQPTPKSPAQPPFFEQVYNQFSQKPQSPAPTMAENYYNEYSKPEGFDQDSYDRLRKAGISHKDALESASYPALRRGLNRAIEFFTDEPKGPLGF